MHSVLLKYALRSSLFLILISPQLFAQKTGNNDEKAPVVFGKITAGDFTVDTHGLDSAATSLIIADIGSSKVQGNSKGWFSIIHHHYRRVHILSKSDYDMADIAVKLYVNGTDEEKLLKVKAKTYNLVGEKIETTEFDTKDIFTDKGDKNHITKKFTLPNVKEGSIIEYEYSTSSDFLFNFQPWSFQGTIPRLWSEYTVQIPEFLNYVSISYGYNPFYIKHEHYIDQSFSVRQQSSTVNSGQYQFNNQVKILRMVMKDVPSLKEEPYTSTLANHVSRIDFQLSGYSQPLNNTRIMGDWKATCQKLLSYDDFGADLYKSNSWLGDILLPMVPTDSSDLYKAKLIYNYVRDNYKSNGRYGILMTKAGLKNVVKEKGGKVADINLLLTAMLRYAKINAHAVILSTSENGVAHTFYPLINQYNYVVAKAQIDGKTYLLDGSQPMLSFGTLLPNCYNGLARTIYEGGEPIYLSSDSIREASQIMIALKPDENGSLVGELVKSPGKYESIRLRAQYEQDGNEGLRKTIEGQLASTMSLDSINFEIESEEKTRLFYKYKLNGGGDHLISIMPLQTEAMKKNPFSSAKRTYPIEMPYGFDETLQFSIQIPQGYAVDEIPKSIVISLDEERLCTYRYTIKQEGEEVNVLSRFVFKRANFDPDEYETLRAFFDMVVKKQNESIVLKKI